MAHLAMSSGTPCLHPLHLVLEDLIIEVDTEVVVALIWVHEVATVDVAVLAMDLGLGEVAEAVLPWELLLVLALLLELWLVQEGHRRGTLATIIRCKTDHL